MLEDQIKNYLYYCEEKGLNKNDYRSLCLFLHKNDLALANGLNVSVDNKQQLKREISLA